jgi:hypothetical protein
MLPPGKLPMSNKLGDPPIVVRDGVLSLFVMLRIGGVELSGVLTWGMNCVYTFPIGLGDPIRWRHRYIYKGVSDEQILCD